MSRNYWDSVYNIIINVSSGWFGIALIRDAFNLAGTRGGLTAMVYNLFMGIVYFGIALYIKEVKSGA